MRSLLLAGALLAPLSSVAVAQESYDHGVLTITHAGAATGRVEFAITASGGRDGLGGFLMVATTRTPAHEIELAVELGRDHLPTTFQETETVGGRVVRRVSATVSGQRLSARAFAPDVDMARELPVRAPYAVIGDEDYTAYYFLPHPDSGASEPVTIVRAHDLTGVAATVNGFGTESVVVAGHRVPCRRFTLSAPDGDERQFWITANGSLVQVAIPASGLIATRSDVPSR